MNLKTWFKGLGVFVASSFITSLAAANLSPSTSNFTKAGLSKMVVLALIVGVKAVLLYLKQSPLPAAGAKIDWSKIAGATVLALVLPGMLLTSGCGNAWEQTTYATLAAGKALIDCAVAGYNHFDADIRHACAADPNDPAFDPARFYIAETRDAQQAIEKARQVQIACVEAFEGYAVAKVGKDPAVSLAAKQAAVTGYLAQLPALLNAVRAFIGATPVSGPTSSGTPRGFSTFVLARGQSPLAAIVSLRASTVSLRSPDRGDHPAGSPGRPALAGWGGHPIPRSFLEVSLGQ
jgi:hypothetical protein